ncbi:MAG TPA: NusA-like transcription termination signal-binding factor [Methanosarcina sp.]|uniref:Probable transcription termination protein NusA n=2 Tax=Methanosarcina TaxID=2207 RepID=A0A0E3WWA6_METBA|nr:MULTISPECIES: NusA-like transcription termination signal-binding factor [Methanosarcina]AKB81994.1 transcription elongation factor NusA-like protein [Methanosarcina barkeri 3]MDW5550743.1 NusA-like transcription termination signal-binding factor [Methanosarcina sp.]MDW5553277.1 NusA-like transcription termination signal-binding factor [Methanosarcina sp.]MDW5558259.1 NusA-like transcription termination signal-binding factor [Methanosarcina sp.]PAV13211.1 transcription elongation factor NusA
MGEIRLTAESIQYIALFENMTRAKILDCIPEEERLVYVVKQGDMGLAIGRNGENINRVKKTLDKPIELVEYSDEPVTFLKNAFGPVSVSSVNIINKNGKRLAYVEVPNKEKGLAIGRNGKNIEKVKMLARRHHNIEDVILQ